MKVKELINHLKQQPEDATVKISILGYVAKNIKSLVLYQNLEETNDVFILEINDSENGVAG